MRSLSPSDCPKGQVGRLLLELPARKIVVVFAFSLTKVHLFLKQIFFRHNPAIVATTTQNESWQAIREEARRIIVRHESLEKIISFFDAHLLEFRVEASQII